MILPHAKARVSKLRNMVKQQYCGSAGHVSQDSVKRYINEQEGKKVFEYDIYECLKELKGQLKIGKWVK